MEIGVQDLKLVNRIGLQICLGDDLLRMLSGE